MFDEEDWDSDIRYPTSKPAPPAPQAVTSSFSSATPTPFSSASPSTQTNPTRTFNFGRGRTFQQSAQKYDDTNKSTSTFNSNYNNKSSYDRNNNNYGNKNFNSSNSGFSSSGNYNSSNSGFSSSGNYNSSNSSGFSSSNRGGYEVKRSESCKRNYEATEPPKPEIKIDWNAVRAQPLQNLGKFKDHPAVVKDFYVEDPEIKAMTRAEVKQYRIDSFNITVDVFKKEKPIHSLTLAKNFQEDTRTPEEIEDYLFGFIPSPVKTIHQAFQRFPEIMAECNRQNFKNPTPVQSQLWPILLKGLDCVGIAQTGTGKTLAFLLPALVHIDNQTTPREKRLGPNVLVLSPTRELAIQIEQEVKKINYKGIKSVCGIVY